MGSLSKTVISVQLPSASMLRSMNASLPPSPQPWYQAWGPGHSCPHLWSYECSCARAASAAPPSSRIASRALVHALNLGAELVTRRSS